MIQPYIKKIVEVGVVWVKDRWAMFRANCPDFLPRFGPNDGFDLHINVNDNGWGEVRGERR